MIKEDFVSSKLAKLLRKKGFDEPCIRYYDELGLLTTLYYGTERVANCELKEKECAAPTLQMVMKWFRQVHHLYLEIVTDTPENGQKGYVIFRGGIYDNNCYNLDGETNNFNTYEECCEYLIEYALTKLI